MALTIINSVADFGNYNDTNADIIMVRDAERTSGNHFIWTAGASPNGGTIYAGASIPTPNIAGAWQMMYEGPINARWFGAKADGNDQRANIQSAINHAASILGAVYLPNGQYLFNSGIKIKNG